jgi:glucose/arabinose dehydrogenase
MRISGEFIIEPLGTMSRTPRHARMPRQQRVASALVLRQIVARIRRVNNTSSSCRRLVLTLAFVVSSLALSSSPLDLGAAEVALKPVAEGFTSPLNLVSLPDGSGRLLIADQPGTVHVVSKDGKTSDAPFLDLRERMVKLNSGFDERGLLGLALHPDFKSNRRLYIYYSAPLRGSAPTNWNHTSRLSEFMATADLAKVGAGTERVLLEFDQPQMNHNGGRILFGPDGYLYIGTGDGGGANDNELGHAAQGNGQDTTTLLGKILRIDVNQGSAYSIPSENPFADGKRGRPEIYAYGLRNPWGLSFDRGGKREFYAADVGQNLYEELNIIVKGGNYGWRVREGFHGFNPKSANKHDDEAPTKDASGKPFVEPVLQYGHPPKNKPPSQVEPQGISVTGGHVYRGKALRGLQGKYVFADWSRSWALPDGVLFTATPGKTKDEKWSLQYLSVAQADGAKFGAYIVAICEDAEGELYILTNGRNSLAGKTGKVFKLEPM